MSALRIAVAGLSMLLIAACATAPAGIDASACPPTYNGCFAD
ncbi:MAG TPA: hypothetical protein PK177_14820 [Burkholderiaceae bacterium]|nr:hypothetical protein [Burkholderiaceae bacterium]